MDNDRRRQYWYFGVAIAAGIAILGVVAAKWILVPAGLALAVLNIAALGWEKRRWNRQNDGASRRRSISS
jgi:hypothetical protein